MQVAEFPDPSVTVHVTMVLSNGKAADALFVIELIVQLSEVVGVPNVTPTAVHPELVPVTTCKGQVIVGKTLSITVIVS